MDWLEIVKSLDGLSSTAILAVVVIFFITYLKSLKKNGFAAIAEKVRELWEVRLRGRKVFDAQTEDAKADKEIEKTYRHSKIASRETKHTRKLQAVTAKAAGVPDDVIEQIAKDIDSDLTGEFRAIDGEEAGKLPDSP